MEIEKLERREPTSKEINRRMLKDFENYFSEGKFKQHCKMTYRVLANNVKAFVGMGVLLASAPWNIATSVRRFLEPSNIEKKLFTPYDVETGEKNYEWFDYDFDSPCGNHYSYLGGLIGAVGGGGAALVQTIMIPSIPFMDSDYWWVPALAVTTNIISALYEKKRSVKKKLLEEDR